MKSRPYMSLMWLVLLSAAQATSVARQTGSGVRTHQYLRDASPPETWRVDPKPLVEIGGTDSGNYTFADIAGTVFLRNGAIAVADAKSAEVRVFKRDGTFEQIIGRRGPGPGEFNVLWSIAASVDTLLVIDNTGRAQVFSADGRLLRSLPRPRPQGLTRPTRAGLMRDGRAIVYGQAWPTDTALDEYIVNFAILTEASTADAYSDPLFTVPAFQQNTRRGQPSSPVRYRPTGKIVARGDRICAGYTETYVVTCYSDSGRPLLKIQRQMQPRTVTEADKEFARQANLEANRGASPSVQQSLAEENRLMRFATLAPAFSRMLLTSDGELWVSEFDRGDNSIGPRSFTVPKKPMRWNVFAANGTWVADILLPAEFIPFDVGRDFVLGVAYDSSDVERVQMWKVNRIQR